MMKLIKSQVLLLVIFFITESLSLHLNMIHRDSIYSPIYPGNLTAHDRLLRISDQAKARANYIEATLSLPPSNSSTLSTQAWSQIRATSYGFLYITDLTIGTPPQQKPLITYHFVLDTGSKLTWVQSEPCKECWAQVAPRFDPAKDSTTWKPLPCSHPLCELRRKGWRCENNQCVYFVKYGGGGTTSGILATDRLGFSSDRGSEEFVNNLVFGCGYENKDFHLAKTFNGLLGLSLVQTSLASQMGRRFSYCLSRFISSTQPPNKLRFGDDAIIHAPNVKRIPFVNFPNKEHYYLPLIDISIAGKRLGFPPGTFTVKKVGNIFEGGFIADSGASTMMFMNNGPYKTIIDGFVDYFKAYNLQRAVETTVYDVCYIKKEGFSSYPTVTFHFENGEGLLVKGDNVVIVTPDVFCVAIGATKRSNFLGAAQQADYKFSYDLAKGELSYVPADCSKDG